jgi:hypothetical protein
MNVTTDGKLILVLDEVRQSRYFVASTVNGRRGILERL